MATHLVNLGTLEYVKIDKAEILHEYDPDAPGTPLSVKYVRQVYRERCVTCHAWIEWRRWVAVRQGLANVRRLKARRYRRCPLCAQNRHAYEMAAAAEDEARAAAAAKRANGSWRFN